MTFRTPFQLHPLRLALVLPVLSLVTACGTQTVQEPEATPHLFQSGTLDTSTHTDSEKVVTNLMQGRSETTDQQGSKTKATEDAADELYRFGLKEDTASVNADPTQTLATTSGEPSDKKPTDNHSPEEQDMTVLVLDKPMENALQQNLQAGLEMTPAMTQVAPPKNRVLFYGLNQSALTPDQQKDIQMHASFLSVHPNYQIQIHGHTDRQGHTAYNEQLSQLRAQRVADALIKAGVKPEQIEIFSWGSSDPLLSAAQLEKNRRVELIYLSDQIALDESNKTSVEDPVSH